MFNFVANILAGISTAAASEGTSRTFFFAFDEVECPKELL